MDTPSRPCRTCKKLYPYTTEFFSRDTRAKSGINTQCLVCNRLRSRQQYKAQPGRAAEWCRKNPEGRKQILARHFQKKKQDAEWYQKRLAEKYVRMKIHYKGNVEMYSERNRERHRELRRQMIAAYGGRCSCCGESAYEFLTLEHVNQTGKEHRKSVGTGPSAYYDLKKKGWPQEGYTILCYNCNLSQRYSGPCPHMNEPVAYGWCG